MVAIETHMLMQNSRFKWLLTLMLMVWGVSAFAFSAGDLDTSLDVGNGWNGGFNTFGLQSDDKIIVAGTFTAFNGTAENYIARLNGDGSLDTSFNAGANAAIAKLAIQGDDKIIISGSFTAVSGTARAGLARLNSDGSLDTGFVPAVGGGQSVAIQSDGKVIVFNGQLKRLNSDGSLDASFTSIVNQNNTIALQADGKMIVGGFAATFPNDINTLSRLKANGTKDTSFNTDGGIGGNGAEVRSLAIQADGKILVGGFLRYYGSGFVSIPDLIRVNADGSLDTTFTADVCYGNLAAAVTAIQIQRDNKILVSEACYDNPYQNHMHRIRRLNSNGSLDASFHGLAIGTPSVVYAEPMAIQKDGKMIIKDGLLMRFYTDASKKNDYNADNIDGWLWKGDSNGVETQSQIWQLTFPLYSDNWGIPTRSYPPIFADQANWEVMTTGDFNKDGDADVLWRNKTTNDWKIWQMQNGLRVGQTNWVDTFDPTHAWSVIGAGDTDKDGDDDIILNNASTGEVMIWEVQNHAVVATHTVGSKAGYAVNRIGDFNRDGDVDLMLSEVGGSNLVIWEIENNTVVLEHTFPTNATGWDLKCAGDFDKDGDDDILLINSSTQQEKWFEIESYGRIAQHVGATNTGFVLLGCGDYDGDGDMDMLWQRSADDMNRVVLQQNWGATKQTVYTNPFGGVNPGAAGYGFIYRGNNN